MNLTNIKPVPVESVDFMETAAASNTCNIRKRQFSALQIKSYGIKV